jgi:hypothetical protein
MQTRTVSGQCGWHAAQNRHNRSRGSNTEHKQMPSHTLVVTGHTSGCWVAGLLSQLAVGTKRTWYNCTKATAGLAAGAAFACLRVCNPT